MINSSIYGTKNGLKAHLVRNTLNAGPATQDEGVVVRENVDSIDTLRLKLGVLRGVWGKVVGVARRLDSYT